MGKGVINVDSMTSYLLLFAGKFLEHFQARCEKCTDTGNYIIHWIRHHHYKIVISAGNK